MKINYNAPLICCVLLGAVTILSSGCKSYNDVAGRYTSKHIKANTNQVTAQIPETDELGYILFALTDVGQADNSILNKETPYYKEVMNSFAGFKNHKAVKLLNADLLNDAKSFNHFRNGLYAFTFNERNQLALKTDYRIDLNRVDFRRYAPLIHDFAVKSKFRKFYKEHSDVYTQIIQNQSVQLDMNSAWASMGKTYTEPFQSYKVILSPLMKGYSSSLAISSHGFRECLIFSESASKAMLYSATVQPVKGSNYND
ncbi:DUF4932 domain-containing protein [Mucilaginibacter galii]|uniref:DUF4932 domain-containing protein n=1 Tax=Mucilaginibacter galii TaxID=2005073 RepID=A0A917JBG3_9SPHI|nr:DUF4932 domain-containing protein [Mucilaginibacter galii]GGI52029.1 hypothetical protein GCM10011425_32410 [Mucilaginibacter galii]